MSSEDGGRLVVAELGRPHGIRGEVTARLFGVTPEELLALSGLTLRRPEEDGKPRRVRVLDVRPRKIGWIVRVDAASPVCIAVVIDRSVGRAGAGAGAKPPAGLSSGTVRAAAGSNHGGGASAGSSVEGLGLGFLLGAFLRDALRFAGGRGSALASGAEAATRLRANTKERKRRTR